MELEKINGEITISHEDLRALIGKEIYLHENETIHRIIQKGKSITIQLAEDGIPRALLNTSVDELGLSVRVHEFFKKENVKTIEHILELPIRTFNTYLEGLYDMTRITQELVLIATRHKIDPTLLYPGMYEKQTK